MKKRYIMAFAVSLLIGMMLVIQARASGGERIYTSRKAIGDYQTMIESEEKTADDVRVQTEEARRKLAQYEADMRNEETDNVIANVESEYEKYSILSGSCAVEGPGVEITVDDGKRELLLGEDINNLIVHDIDILMIINELRRSGAEAISVNGQRIVDSTAINCSGWTIRINGRTYARPFVIRAIGDGKRMVSALLAEQGYGTSLREWGVQFAIEIKDNVQIDAYDGSRLPVYAQESEGEKKTQ